MGAATSSGVGTAALAWLGEGIVGWHFPYAYLIGPLSHAAHPHASHPARALHPTTGSSRHGVVPQAPPPATLQPRAAAGAVRAGPVPRVRCHSRSGCTARQAPQTPAPDSSNTSHAGQPPQPPAAPGACEWPLPPSRPGQPRAHPRCCGCPHPRPRPPLFKGPRSPPALPTPCAPSWRSCSGGAGGLLGGEELGRGDGWSWAAGARPSCAQRWG
jgi:hypothetical protein